MRIVPAIDLRNNQIVRLTQGDYNRTEIYDIDPAKQVRQFQNDGAEHLHVVDLDGAKSGKIENMDAIKKIINSCDLKIEIGGGIRSEDSIYSYLELGIDKCILGTKAIEDYKFLEDMLSKYEQHIAVGVDTKNGFVATDGWLKTSKIRGIDFCLELEKSGCKNVIYTDISKDGAMQGTNIEHYEELHQKLSRIEITASGGISQISEIETLVKLGIDAAILGKSLYTGAINLKQAILKSGPQC